MAFQLPRQFDIEVARGEVAGYEAIAIIGQNSSVGTTFEDIWDVGGNFIYPTAGETWEVVSDNVADTSVGTGAREVLISALDANYIEQTETISMNGTTPVVTTRTDWFRLGLQSSMVVTSSGSGQINAGNISLKVSGGADRSLILSERGRTFNSLFTVPVGKTLLVTDLQAIIPKNQDIILLCRVLVNGTNTFVGGANLPLYQNSIVTHFSSIPTFPEKTDIRLTAKSTNSKVSVQVFIQAKVVQGTIDSGGSQIRSM